MIQGSYFSVDCLEICKLSFRDFQMTIHPQSNMFGSMWFFFTIFSSVMEAISCSFMSVYRMDVVPSVINISSNTQYMILRLIFFSFFM